MASFFLQTALVPGLATLLRSARAHGATTSVDPNWDPAQRWDGGLLELLGEVDVLLPNAAEACRLAGVSDAEAAAAKLAAAGPLVAVKLGAEGAVAAPAGGEGRLVRAAPPERAVDPVDAVGAGDAFDAGLLCALLGGQPLDVALAFACACGTLSMRAARRDRGAADARRGSRGHPPGLAAAGLAATRGPARGGGRGVHAPPPTRRRARTRA